MAKPKASQEPFYCRGYHDKHGIWNNGFACPQWGGPEEQYCCGTDVLRYCCPQPEETPEETIDNYIPLIIGVCVAAGVLLCLLFTCLFCSCCPIYRRRKRLHEHTTEHTAESVYDPRCPACRQSAMIAMVPQDDNSFGAPCPSQNCRYTGMRLAQNGYPVTYAVCESPSVHWNEGLSRLGVTYPVEDPPPYTEVKDKATTQAPSSDQSSEPGTSTLRSTMSRRRSSSNLLDMATAMASDLANELSSAAAAETANTLKRNAIRKHSLGTCVSRPPTIIDSEDIKARDNLIQGQTVIKSVEI